MEFITLILDQPEHEAPTTARGGRRRGCHDHLRRPVFQADNRRTTCPKQQTLRNEPIPNEPPVPRPETLQTNITPAPPAAAAGVHKSSLVIESPKDGETVSTNASLTGRIDSEGWPAIFVQAALPGQPWWCQAPIARVDGGKFSTQVIFGDEFTPSGMKFRIVGVVARTHEEAIKFQTGYKAQALPEGLPQSAEVVVTHR